MRQRMASDLHSGGGHLPQLAPGDVSRRIDERRDDEESRAQVELIQHREGFDVVALVAVIEGEAVEEPTELVGHLAVGHRAAPGRAPGEQKGAEVLHGQRVRVMAQWHVAQLRRRHEIVEDEERRAGPHAHAAAFARRSA